MESHLINRIDPAESGSGLVMIQARGRRTRVLLRMPSQLDPGTTWDRELMVIAAPIENLSDDDVMSRLEAAGWLVTERGEVRRVKGVVTLEDDIVSTRERVLNVVGWRLGIFAIWFVIAYLLMPEPWGPAGKVILLIMQFYALMISLPFVLSNRRSVIHRSVERAGAAMLAGLALNAAKQNRDSQ